MRLKTLALATFAVSVISCDNDDPQPENEISPKEFYTVTVDPGYTFGGSEENWVFATNANGELLDGKSFDAGDVVKLESTTSVDENFNLHFLAVDKMVSGKPYFKLTSYNEIPVTGSWKLVNPQSGNTIEPKVTGEMHIKLENYPNEPDILFHQNIKVSGPAGNQVSSMVGTGTTLDINVTLLENNTNLLVSFSKYQHSYYAEVPATPGSVITLDANSDFETVQRQFAFYLEDSNFAHIGFYGFNNGDDVSKTGYIISERIDNDGKLFGNFGYNDGFDQYRTIIFYGQENYTRTYYKFGGKVDGYPYFNTLFTSMSKTGIMDFICTVGAPYSHASIFFHNPTANDVTWEIVSPRSELIPELKFGVKEIPEELSSKYPSLNLSQLTFKNGGAVQYLDGFNYQDYISFKANINEVTKKNSNEYTYYEWK